jgi:hypothetical protein
LLGRDHEEPPRPRPSQDENQFVIGVTDNGD